MNRTLLFVGAGARTDSWINAFAEVAPEIDFQPYEPGQDVSDVPYCLAWKAPPGIWPAMKNLKIIFGIGAGVDRLLADSSLPRDVPLVRMVEPELTRGMVEYVLWQCLFHHRKVWELEAAQSCSTWRPHSYPAPWDRTIGIMGLGELGSAAAERLVEFGFTVRGWSRTPKSLPKVESFFGADQLPAFLSKTEILVCLLPLTADTRGILNAALFAQLPRRASIINAARGGHLVEADLSAAMASGQINAATLDVFETEPLPPEHPFWSTERLYITPHNASITDPRSAAWRIAKQIAKFEAGEGLDHVVDCARGY
ncbi:2-hydroxyacid dehydrogenase [Dongia deserti]|uniref:2-hydroxyacid dehydrogenase n=1 Tax=Dongia deserti TaxID=2268030 RepID=UPI000E65B2F8|nr:glyoxylate/hydroxypyruvate reductase A [Dongia deserti]